MCSGELTGGSPFLYCEQLWTIAAVQFFEAVYWDSRSACDKLEQPRPHLIIERIHSLQNSTNTVIKI